MVAAHGYKNVDKPPSSIYLRTLPSVNSGPPIHLGRSAGVLSALAFQVFMHSDLIS